MGDHLLRGLGTVRKLLGFTAEECAKRLAITPSSYSRHERGERRMYFDKVYYLAQYLGVPMELFTQELTIEQRQALWVRGEKRRELLGKGANADIADALMDWGEPAPSQTPAPTTLTTLGPDPVVSQAAPPVQPPFVDPTDDPELAGLTEAERVARIMEDWGNDAD